MKVKHDLTTWDGKREAMAFSQVGQAVRAYCAVMEIEDDDRLDTIYEKVIDLLVQLTD